jgi:hypothetical protein
MVADQLAAVTATRGPGQMASLIRSKGTWQVD